VERGNWVRSFKSFDIDSRGFLLVCLLGVVLDGASMGFRLVGGVLSRGEKPAVVVRPSSDAAGAGKPEATGENGFVFFCEGRQRFM